MSDLLASPSNKLTTNPIGHPIRHYSYWKTFDPYVIPLLAKPMDLSRFEEM